MIEALKGLILISFLLNLVIELAVGLVLNQVAHWLRVPNQLAIGVTRPLHGFGACFMGWDQWCLPKQVPVFLKYSELSRDQTRFLGTHTLAGWLEVED
jgi:hypothetical protein